MSFSDKTVKQRKKEVKTLKSFLVYGFILFLVLNIGVIATVVFNFLSKKNQVEEKPIETTFTDMPIQEEVKPESKLIKQEKPVKQELLNETKSINLDNIPVFKPTPQPQRIQQSSKTDNEPSKQPSNQTLSTPAPAETASEFNTSENENKPKKPRKTQRENNKLQRQKLRAARRQARINRKTPTNNPQIKKNVDTSLTKQPSPVQDNNLDNKNDTQPKKPRKTQRENNKLQRQKLRAARRQARRNQETPTNNTQVEENVDTSLTEQSLPIQDNNQVNVNNSTPSAKPSPTDNRKKPTKKTRRRINRQRNRNQRDSKVTRDAKKSELVSDLKQSSTNSKLESDSKKPADTQTNKKTSETNSNINSSNNNSTNDTKNNPESNISKPETVSTPPNPVTTSQSEDIKGDNSANNNNIDISTKKPNSNSKPSTTAKIPASEDNSVSGSAKISSDGQAACRKCKIDYPKWALRRKIQGKIVVAVDADAKGNIIPSSIRLVTSTGNDKLDDYHLKRVKKWKLKRSENGQTGVKIGYEYILK